MIFTKEETDFIYSALKYMEWCNKWRTGDPTIKKMPDTKLLTHSIDIVKYSMLCVLNHDIVIVEK